MINNSAARKAWRKKRALWREMKPLEHQKLFFDRSVDLRPLSKFRKPGTEGDRS